MFWSSSNGRIIYHRSKGYNCIFAIKATRAAKNGPQQNHKFINPPPMAASVQNERTGFSVVALANETQKHKLVFEQK